MNRRLPAAFAVAAIVVLTGCAAGVTSDAVDPSVGSNALTIAARDL
jgi:hypothetical protein